jgi:pSer/pThr/pTyr-binding forkhead associated (FHA) protein
VHVLSVQQNATASASNQTVAWLYGVNGVHAGEDFRLTQGEVMLGSGWDSDIVLTSPDVSRTHAKITSAPQLCIIEDLGSSDGTHVNGQRCDDPRALQHGDVVRIGLGEFVYVALDRLMDDSAEQESVKPSSSMPESKAVRREQTRGWLICQSGELRGVDFRLVEGINRIGNLPGLEVTVPDANLNSVHFSIECSKERFYLRPGASGLQILREKNPVNQGLLKDGDILQIGALQLRLRCMT